MAWCKKQENFSNYRSNSLDKRFAYFLLGQVFIFLDKVNFCKGYVVDIGAGSGDFLRLVAKEYCLIPVGIEPFKATQIKGIGENLPVKNGLAELVLVNAVLDHSINPFRIILEAKKVLKKNGFLMLVQQTMKFRGYDPTHLHQFSRSSLINLLMGFEIVCHKEYFCFPKIVPVNFFFSSLPFFGWFFNRKVSIILAKKI